MGDLVMKTINMNDFVNEEERVVGLTPQGDIKDEDDFYRRTSAIANKRTTNMVGRTVRITNQHLLGRNALGVIDLITTTSESTTYRVVDKKNHEWVLHIGSEDFEFL